MNKERARFEVLLEEMRSNFKLLAEGQAVLRGDIKRLGNKIDTVDLSLRHELAKIHSSLKNEIKFTNLALNEKIEGHIKQPSHAG